MLGLNQDTVNLIGVIAVSLMAPLLALLLAAMLSRQIKTWGFTNWGPDGKDITDGI